MYSLTKGMSSYVENDILVRQIACLATLPYFVPENATIASEFNVRKFNATISKGEVTVDNKLYYFPVNNNITFNQTISFQNKALVEFKKMKTYNATLAKFLEKIKAKVTPII